MDTKKWNEEVETWSENPDLQMKEEDAQMDFELRRASLEDTSVPDADEAFEQFKAERLGKSKRRALSMRLWAVAAVAACLVLAVFRPWNHWQSSSSPIAEVPIPTIIPGTVVYEAPAPMGDIAVTVGDKTINLHSSDAREQGFSISQNHMIQFLAPEGVSPEDRTTLTIPQGKTAMLQLHDGTKVWLSACSRLTFPQKFLDNVPREVRLIGEAYFEVSHDKVRPFIVHSGKVNTTVLGTRFNIRSFDNEQPRVTLVSGSVRVSSGKNVGERCDVTLVPGQQAVLGANNSLLVEEADVEGVLSWKHGAFYFEGQTLREVLTEIGRWYNLNVIFTTNQHLDDPLHYNADRSWKIQQVVSQLNNICETHIKIKNNNLIVDE